MPSRPGRSATGRAPARPVKSHPCTVSSVVLIFLLPNSGRAPAGDMSVDRRQRLLPVRLRMEVILVERGRESYGRGFILGAKPLQQIEISLTILNAFLMMHCRMGGLRLPGRIYGRTLRRMRRWSRRWHQGALTLFK